jgi:hypothetical protein
MQLAASIGTEALLYKVIQQWTLRSKWGLAALVYLSLISTSGAITEQEMAAALQNPNYCPADRNLVSQTTIREARCNERCCKGASTSDCNICWGECVGEVNRINAVIRRYNEMVRRCDAAFQPRSSPAQPPRPAGQPSSGSPSPGNRPGATAQSGSPSGDMATRINAARRTNESRQASAPERLRQMRQQHQVAIQQARQDYQRRLREAEEERRRIEAERRAQQERQERIRREEEERRRREANTIPAGWIRCQCPHYHTGRLIFGVLYHPEGGSCP